MNSGPCVNEDAFNCFSSNSDFAEFPMPASYAECPDCNTCASEIVSQDLCQAVFDDDPNVIPPASCGTVPELCAIPVLMACGMTFETTNEPGKILIKASKTRFETMKRQFQDSEA